MNNEKKVLFCSNCGKKIVNDQPCCMFCGHFINQPSNNTINNQNNIPMNNSYSLNKKTAIFATIFSVIVYVVLLGILLFITNIGHGFSGDSNISITKDIIKNLPLCFFFTFIPFGISLYYAKKSEMDVLFTIEFIFCIINIILFFIV